MKPDLMRMTNFSQLSTNEASKMQSRAASVMRHTSTSFMAPADKRSISVLQDRNRDLLDSIVAEERQNQFGLTGGSFGRRKRTQPDTRKEFETKNQNSPKDVTIFSSPRENIFYEISRKTVEKSAGEQPLSTEPEPLPPLII